MVINQLNYLGGSTLHGHMSHIIELCFGDATKQDWNISKHGMMMMMMMIGTTKPEQPAKKILWMSSLATRAIDSSCHNAGQNQQMGNIVINS